MMNLSSNETQNQTIQFKNQLTIKTKSKSITHLSFSPDSKKLAISNSNSSIEVYQLIHQINPHSNLHFIHFLTLTGHQKGINELTWSNDSNLIGSASDDLTLKIWSIDWIDRSYNPKTLIGHSNFVYCLKFHPLGTLIVSGSFDESIKIWNTSNKKLIRTLLGHSEVVSSLDFSKDGSVIVSASFDGLTRLWDTATGQCLKTLVVDEETHAPVSFVAFTPNSNYLLTCALDSIVRLWDYKTKEGTIVKSFKGHTNTKYSIPAKVMAIGNEGKAIVIMGSEDGKIWIWDLQSREIVQILDAHSDSVICIETFNDQSNHQIFLSSGLEKEAGFKLFKNVTST
ncbi:WD40-repeat-containing domain protein [Melampsora americana]|nr:WD40-repeat-containing domain protein [Melampsora americana]